MSDRVNDTMHPSGEHTLPETEEELGSAEMYALKSEHDIVARWDESALPGWHPHHVCGIFCDGQDGPMTSECGRSKRNGPPIGWTLGDPIVTFWP